MNTPVRSIISESIQAFADCPELTLNTTQTNEVCIMSGWDCSLKDQDDRKRISSYDEKRNKKYSIGTRFGKWTVISLPERHITKSGNRAFTAACRCECGNERRIYLTTLSCGDSTQCRQCQRAKDKVRRSESRTRHGMWDSRTYSSWQSMKSRCTLPSATSYENYGGRGITVCDKWLNSFEAFYRDMGERPEGTSIDRIDTNGNYNAANCRWSTNKEQNNNRRGNRRYVYLGESLTVSQWAERTGIEDSTLRSRLKKWSVAKAITTPINLKMSEVSKRKGKSKNRSAA